MHCAPGLGEPALWQTIDRTGGRRGEPAIGQTINTPRSLHTSRGCRTTGAGEPAIGQTINRALRPRSGCRIAGLIARVLRDSVSLQICRGVCPPARLERAYA